MMDAESLQLAVKHAGLAATGVAFLTGLVRRRLSFSAETLNGAA
jgi:hypothetical protein